MRENPERESNLPRFPLAWHFRSRQELGPWPFAGESGGQAPGGIRGWAAWDVFFFVRVFFWTAKERKMRFFMEKTQCHLCMFSLGVS